METFNINPETKKKEKEETPELTKDQVEAKIGYAEKEIELNNKTIRTYENLKKELQEEMNSDEGSETKKKIENVNEIIEKRKEDNEEKRQEIEDLKEMKAAHIKKEIERLNDLKEKREKALEEGEYPDKITEDMTEEVNDFNDEIDALKNELEELT